MSENKLNPYIFRAYDIRGIVGTDLTKESVELIGKGIGTYFVRNNLRNISVGRDNRLSSESLKNALIDGLLSTGLNVIDIGLSSSPLLYTSVMVWNLDGGINVTGSHNPIQFNGFKVVSRNARPVAAEEIQEIREFIDKNDFEHGKGSLSEKSPEEEYFQVIRKSIKLERPMKIAIDTGNGVGGLFAPKLLKSLGCEVVELYTELDGSFPNHLPDPETEVNLADLSKAVVEHNAEVGFGYDGDADRLGMVDEKGVYRAADLILILLARDYLTRHPGEQIFCDIKVSNNVINDIRKHGGIPFLWKTGHSLIKRKMVEDKINLGGELSGHLFVFEDFFPFDDGIYASLKILQYLSKTKTSISEMLSDLPKLFSTLLIEVPTPDAIKFEVVKNLTRIFSEKYSVNDIDGARIEFEHGWAVVRASNTTPNLTVRFESDSEEGLKLIQDEVYSVLSSFPEVNVEGRIYR